MANSTILYACTEHGLGIVNKPGTSTEWLPLRMVLQDRGIASVWAEPGPPIRVMAVTSSGDLLLSENGGRTWSPVSGFSSVAGIFESGDPPLPHIVTQEGTVARTTDGVMTWESLPFAAGEVQVSPGTSVVPAGEYIYVRGTGSGSSNVLRGNLATGEWSDMELDGAMSLAYDSDKGGLYVCTPLGVYASAGSTWTLLPGSPRDGTCIVAIPGPTAKPPTLLVGTPTGLSVSPDTNAWQPVDLPHEGSITDITRDPERRDRVYAATAAGYLLESGNRGRTWQAVNSTPIGSITYLFVVRI
ncbi:MAG: hypothetical protein QOH93_1049 [Chloroflexia bacterium]|jgi:photosystem II stability/assembly factor-like uncharacterized protein|nr:hypothetical protein [Chloroflexia bacterium]